MVRVDEFTTIRVRKSTRNKLYKMKNVDETLADVLDRMIEHGKGRRRTHREVET